MGSPFVFVRRVRFEEIDAAGIVYFPRFFTFCHDAMEAMLLLGPSRDSMYGRLAGIRFCEGE